MTDAESLRREMENACPFSKEQFIEAVSNGIRNDGYFGFTLNNRYESGWSFINGAHIPSRYLDIVEKWAYEEGFVIRRESTYYGVHCFWVSLKN